jgi:hypothetical protein
MARRAPETLGATVAVLGAGRELISRGALRPSLHYRKRAPDLMESQGARTPPQCRLPTDRFNFGSHWNDASLGPVPLTFAPGASGARVPVACLLERARGRPVFSSKTRAREEKARLVTLKAWLRPTPKRKGHSSGKRRTDRGDQTRVSRRAGSPPEVLVRWHHTRGIRGGRLGGVAAGWTATVAVVAVVSVVGSTACFARVSRSGFAHGSGFVRQSAPAFSEALPQMPASGIPATLAAPAQALIINEPVSQPH